MFNKMEIKIYANLTATKKAQLLNVISTAVDNYHKKLFGATHPCVYTFLPEPELVVTPTIPIGTTKDQKKS
jgi:hypothetical protein